jgi:hypothetical protein
MLRKHAFFLTVLLVIIGLNAYAQQPSKGNRSKSFYTVKRFNYKATRVRGEKAKIVCPIFANSKYPYHGFGFKLGDPFALTYKFYANKKMAFALDFGKPASSLYNRYYREKFNSYINTDTFSTAEARIIPITHKVKSDLILEAKALYHVDVSKISAGLQMYVGAGWEWKRTSLQYDYTYSTGDFRQLDEFGRFTRSRFTMGPQLVMGIEYAYFHIPISAFMELEYFSDIQADPGYSRLEGGVGLRYVF